MRLKRSVVAVAAAGAAGVTLAGFARPRYLHWGATREEIVARLPGDDLLADADLTATRAVTIRASAERTWPWVAQLGQGRGGFYSYDLLENLVGCQMQSADRIMPEHRVTAVGDEVRLHPDVPLEVAVLEVGRALVLRGGIPIGDTPPPYDFTWTFVLRDGAAGVTRLVVRERYAYTRWWAPLLIEPVELVSFAMSRRMLRGIRDRAERGGGGPAGAPPWNVWLPGN